MSKCKQSSTHQKPNDTEILGVRELLLTLLQCNLVKHEMIKRHRSRPGFLQFINFFPFEEIENILSVQWEARPPNITQQLISLQIYSSLRKQSRCKYLLREHNNLYFSRPLQRENLCIKSEETNQPPDFQTISQQLSFMSLIKWSMIFWQNEKWIKACFLF